jgi:hypothetical protein
VEVRCQRAGTAKCHAHPDLLVYALVLPTRFVPSSSSDSSGVPGYYWVVNQILAKQLHTKSAQILTYATTLMDQLEKVGKGMCRIGPEPRSLAHICTTNHLSARSKLSIPMNQR